MELPSETVEVINKLNLSEKQKEETTRIAHELYMDFLNAPPFFLQLYINYSVNEFVNKVHTDNLLYFPVVKSLTDKFHYSILKESDLIHF